MRDEQINRLVLAGIISAIIIVLTALISIPLPGGHGYINLGDAAVLTAAFVLGGPWGALCGGAASAVSDLLLGWGIYAPATFFIKGGMAMVAALFLKQRKSSTCLWSLYPASLLVPAGYFLFESLMYGSTVALPNLPLNLVQCLLGAGVAHTVIAVIARKELPVRGAQSTDSVQNLETPKTPDDPEIVREPKGGPDVVLIGCEQELKTLIKAGDYLSVRGYTARIVKLPSKTVFSALTSLQREAIVPKGIPYVCITECCALQGAEAADIAKAALEAIQS